VISYIGLGSNLGSRRDQIKNAVQAISKIDGLKILNQSFVYENPAVTSEETKMDWDKTFLNTALKVETQERLNPLLLLSELKKIERNLGRTSSARWSARPIDLDILSIENKIITSEELTVPHKLLSERNFVTAPLRDLSPHMKINETSILEINRKVENPLPVWMGIANATPDSFSDGGALSNVKNFEALLTDWTKASINVMDLGAESTRPGAAALTAKEEKARLKPYLQIYSDCKNEPGLPTLSLDSRNYETIKWALSFGVKIVNDVSGLADVRILDLIKDHGADYILMHSLSVPADLKQVLNPKSSTTDEIKKWLSQKLDLIEQAKVPLDQVIFDPGIGFGKTAVQSIELLRNLDVFHNYKIRLLAGHSRKSFMKSFTKNCASQRDFESIGFSLALANKGVDFLRVHNPIAHKKTHLGFAYAH